MPIITLATICPSTIGQQPHCAGAEGRSSSSVPAATLSGKMGGGCCSGCSGKIGGAVMLSSGNYNFKLPLLSIESLGGIGWSFELNFLGGNGAIGFTGIGFNHSHNLTIQADSSDNNVRLLSGDNTQELFIWSSPYLYAPATNNNTAANLVRTNGGMSNDTFTLTSSQGTVTTFYGFSSTAGPPGRPSKIVDRYGNKQSYLCRAKF